MKHQVENRASLKPDAHIGVVGAGAMGAGIAQVASQAGHKVFLYDQNEEASFRAKESISLLLNKKVAKGTITREHYDTCIANIIPLHSLDELKSADLIIEAIVETLEIKQSLFRALELICKPECILASNTSSISITAIASCLKYPERFLGLHFFNPAPVMPLVEVISGLASDQLIAKQLYDTCLLWGKTPVKTKSTPGFIVNRVARPFYAEALRIYEEQGAGIQQIDRLMKTAGQFRMGPFELMDLIGHDVNYAVTLSVFNAYYQDPKFKPSLTQKSLVEAGFLGKKAARGFYTYDDSGQKLNTASNFSELGNEKLCVLNASDSYKTSSQVELLPVSNRGGHSQPNVKNQPAHPLKRLITRFNKIGLISESQLQNEIPFTYLKYGEAVVALTDGRTATERSALEAIDNLILIDMAFDFEQVTSLGMSVSAFSSNQAIQDAMTLFKLIEIDLIALEDIPGLIVMRTLAMLTNEAAQTCMQGIASAKDIDIAMCYGVNYPQGPLAWGQRVGVDYVFQVLSHLQAHYGEERYRASSLIKRLSLTGETFY
ncbi:3-hydroxybutyryl-CoA dehydrogenase [Marinomonas sp. MED121]|uniref:3-hydroxyacyl-CoA dehydrogenase n=1 Tax=Marinomonas sp. MED121 TaxID=314277 RepID=UPI000068FA49|nr:3-hydroxyacyl-CoA dehydrogenase [Marinomonas sp. MED121]EAQ64147.1 3-hydroxybutyryl-CoA dehydrogenase [Marinomonas sp. MED121]